ncbi:Dom-3 Z, partial [Entomortierella chlamydospora]
MPQGPWNNDSDNNNGNGNERLGPPAENPNSSRPYPGQREGGRYQSSHDHRDRTRQQYQHPYHRQNPSGHPQYAAPSPIRLIPGQPPPFAAPPSLHHQRHWDSRATFHPQQQYQQGNRNRDFGGHHHDEPAVQYSENQFAVHPLNRFKVKCAPFQQPIEIGSFSYTEQREFVMDDSQLKYYFPPDLSKPNNLSVNYDKYISRDTTVDEHLDALLDALICIRDSEDQQNQKKEEEDKDHVSETFAQGDNSLDTKPTPTSGSSTRDNNRSSSNSNRGSSTKGSMTRADFVCYRGILTKIMCTPYTRNEPWELGATLYKGTIYIEEHVTPEKRSAALGTSERHKLMSYWGYRFETICNISKPVSELRRTKVRKRAPGTAAVEGPGAETGSGNKKRRSSDSHNSDSQTAESQREDSRQPGSNKRARLLENDSSAAPDNSENEESMNPSAPSQSETSGSCENVDSSNANNNSGDGGNNDKGGEESEEEEYIEQINLQDPELTGRLDGIVDTNLQYCTVARTKIGRNSIIMGAEVDCISEPKKPPPFNPLSHYIELKTSRAIGSDRDRRNFERHKLLKFWAQSFLPGIPTIIVGFRDDDGNVMTVETLKTMEIPRLVRGKESEWDSTICINFLDGVLNFLRKKIVNDDPDVTYTIRWAAPFNAIEVECAGKKNAFLTARFLD